MTVTIRKDITQDKIYSEAKQENNAKIKARMLAMAAILEGKTKEKVAKIAEVKIDSFRKWVERFNK